MADDAARSRTRTRDATRSARSCAAREERRGAPLRLVPTRANTQPAFGCYLPVPETDVARAYALFVLTLEGDRISAITWFADSSVFPQFGLPRMLRRER